MIGNGGLNVGQMTHGASGQSARVAQKALQSFWKNAPRGPDFHFYSRIKKITQKSSFMCLNLKLLNVRRKMDKNNQFIE